MTGSEIRDLPTLRRWLDRLTDHPLQWLFEPRRDLRPGVVWAWWRDPVLIAVEETLVALERVQPLGLGQKRREFRTVKGKNIAGMAALDPVLSELVVGSLLVEGGVPFRYNTGAGPDLLIGRDDVRFAIEVGARRPRSLHELSRRLTAGLRDRGLPSSVSISTDPFPSVAIRTSVLNAILEQFLPSDGSPGVTSLRTIAAPGRQHLGIPDSWVTIHVGGGRIMTQAPWNSPHMNALALEVATTVLRERRKVVQARTWPTILIADLTGGDLPDIRYWNDVFDDLWQADDEYLMVAAMTRLTTRRMPTLAFSINPYADRDTVKQAATVLDPVPGFHDLGDRLAGRKRRQ